MTWLADPRLFSYASIALFVLAMVRFAFAGQWAQACYHLGAVILNVAVLSMSK